MVLWGENVTGRKWSVAWNRVEDEGAPGAIRAEITQGWVIGSTDLRDGRWHHVAVTADPQAGLEFKDQIVIYVDGQPERISGARHVPMDTSAQGQVQFGSHDGARLRGALDEIYIFPTLLTAAEVTELMRRNQVSSRILALPER
jgi:hypothetical protein